MTYAGTWESICRHVKDTPCNGLSCFCVGISYVTTVVITPTDAILYRTNCRIAEVFT